MYRCGGPQEGGRIYSLRIASAAMALVASFFYCVDFIHAQDTTGISGEKRSEIERQIAVLETEAERLDAVLAGVGKEKRTLATEVKGFETEIRRREIEIQKISLAIRKANLEIQSKTAAIGTLAEKIDHSRKALGASLFLYSTYEQDSLIAILLKHRDLSDFFDSLHDLEKAKQNITVHLTGFKEDKMLEEAERGDLQDFQKDQTDLKTLQEIERRALAQKKKEKDNLLALTKGKEALFQKLLQSKKRDIATLRTQLFYLEKTGVTAEEAIQFAEKAAQRTGIRTAFLLALLEVETGKQFEDGIISVGTNLGTGNWKTDMYDCYVALKKKSAAEAEKTAFFAITGKLGLDPDKMPVSRKPNYGCGGAMGHAQFLPTTWLSFEDRVAQLTGHNPPSPWTVEDAFTAAAVFLADAGADAKTSSGEIAAAKTYISGNPSCSRSICRYYSNRIIALAKEIDRTL